MIWQRYANLDPYLCGARAAAERQEQTAEQEADAIGLVSDRRADFIRGWNDEIDSQAQERKALLMKEYDEMAAGYEQGDPAEQEEHL